MFLRWIISIFLNAVTLIIVVKLFDSFHIYDFGTALLVSFFLSLLYLFVILIFVLFTLPITFITFGLFLFVINAITLMITQAFMSPDFYIANFGIAIVAAIIIAILNTILNQLVKDTLRT